MILIMRSGSSSLVRRYTDALSCFCFISCSLDCELLGESHISIFTTRNVIVTFL